jgi:hypothetical protein
MKRTEAVAFLKELSLEHLIQPSSVRIEQIYQNRYELQIKGFYDLDLTKACAEKHNLAVKEDTAKGYLSIFRP